VPTPSDQAFSAYEEHLALGHKAMGRGDGRAALEEYRAAAELADERALPHVLVGRALLALGHWADALAAFERALERAANDSSALAGKAEALLRLGRRSEAAAIRQQIERASAPGIEEPLLDGTEGVLSRAEMLTLTAERAWQAGQHEAALAQWIDAARAHAADGHLDAALDVCQRALIADGGAVSVHLQMCRLYLASGLEQQAVERLLLLGRLAELDAPPEVLAALAVLASENAGLDARLATLARRLGSPPPG
jgi:tetratricopeptide (TPR) repeat protein